MTGVLQEGTLRRRRREQLRRARRRRRIAFGALVLILTAAAVFLAAPGSVSHRDAPKLKAGVPGSRTRRHPTPVPQPPRDGGYGLVPANLQLHPRLHGKLASGLLFDVRTGHVLWQRDSERILPIASLTKMMTALLVSARTRPDDPVYITRAAVDFSGSGVGLLPLHKHVSAEALLYGLLLPSGNDAAIALSVHVAGVQSAFVAMMNRQATALRLSCTRFASVSGIIDRGNHSCAADLSVLAHAILTDRRLARIVASRQAVIPFPIKGGKLYLYNNNPLLIDRFPGTDGVKTGYTVAAGPCLVAAVRRGSRWFGVVLLHSSDTRDQAEALLDDAFAATAPRPRRG